MTFHRIFVAVKIHTYNFQILVPFFNLSLVICLTLPKLHVYVIKKYVFYFRFF